MRDAACRSGDSHYAGCACHEARWEEKLAAAEERARRLEEALLGLVEQLDRVHADPSYQGVWGLYAAHGCKYVGLTYVVEQEAARALLAPPPEAEKKGGE